MDFQKLKSMVYNSVVLDLECASEHELRVNYSPGDDDCWIEFTPEQYKTEEELAEAINTVTIEQSGGKFSGVRKEN